MDGTAHNVSETDMASAAFVVMDNGDLQAKGYGRNIYDRIRQGLHFIFVALVALRDVTWQPPPKPLLPSEATNGSVASVAVPQSSWATSSDSLSAPIIEPTTTKKPPKGSVQKARDSASDPIPVPEMTPINTGVGAAHEIPVESMEHLREVLKDRNLAESLFSLERLRLVDAELENRLQIAIADGSAVIDATTLNGWMSEMRPAREPPRTNVTVLAPVNASASSDAGILTAILRIGQTLRVRAANGMLLRYVVLVVDQAIYARVWRLVKQSKGDLEWVLPFSGKPVPDRHIHWDSWDVPNPPRPVSCCACIFFFLRCGLLALIVHAIRARPRSAF